MPKNLLQATLSEQVHYRYAKAMDFLSTNSDGFFVLPLANGAKFQCYTPCWPIDLVVKTPDALRHRNQKNCEQTLDIWSKLACVKIIIDVLQQLLSDAYAKVLLVKIKQFRNKLRPMPKTSEKIALHYPIDMPTSSTTYLIRRFSKIFSLVKHFQLLTRWDVRSYVYH